MSKKLLSHVSLSSLPKRLKSPREESSPSLRHSAAGTKKAGGDGGWSKSSNPLEKLMQEAKGPAEASAALKEEERRELPRMNRSLSGEERERESEETNRRENSIRRSKSDSAETAQVFDDGRDLERREMERERSERHVRKKKREDGLERKEKLTKSPRRSTSSSPSSTSKKKKKNGTQVDVPLPSSADSKQKRSRKTRRNVADAEEAGEEKKPSRKQRSKAPESDERQEGKVDANEESTWPSLDPLHESNVKRELSTRSSEASDADEVLERTLRLVRSLSTYKFKRGASMDDILQDISSDGGDTSTVRSRREDSDISTSTRLSTSGRVTKNMTNLANQVTLGTEEVTEREAGLQDGQPTEGNAKKEDSKRKPSSRRPSFSISSLDLDELEEDKPKGGRKRKKTSKSPMGSPRRAALANSTPGTTTQETEDAHKKKASVESPLLKRISSAFTWATKKTSDPSEDPEELEKFFQQKLKATKEVLESVHAAEMMAKRRYRQLQREERELLKKCEQLSDGNSTLKRHSGASHDRTSADLTPAGVSFSILTSEIGLCEQIGRGASGTVVYRCIVDGWACAVKELKASPGQFHCAEEKDAFEKEMAYLFQLPRHPNIVQYLFHSKMNQQYCLFMALYDGTLREDIDSRVARGETLDVCSCTWIALEVSKGLAFLHSQQLLHRDIKADNIFIGYGESGEFARVAIGDFDSATRIGYSFSPDSCVGTPGFMAPEVMKSYTISSTYSYEADVYSFGMLLYEMVTMQFPYYECPSNIMITKSVLNGKLPTISAPVEARFPDLVALLRKCISTQARDRPTMAEASAILEVLFTDLQTAMAGKEAGGRNQRTASVTPSSSSAC